GRGPRFVNVHLDDAGAVSEFRGRLVDDWRHHAARAAPRGPEVDEDRNLRLKNFRGKRAVGEILSRHGLILFRFGRESITCNRVAEGSALRQSLEPIWLRASRPFSGVGSVTKP